MTEGCKIKCNECPLSVYNNTIGFTCNEFEGNYPKKAIKIVQKWSDEHPSKTILSDFIEKYPNAPLNDDGIPKTICIGDLGLNDLGLCKAGRNCIECWNRPIESEVEE